MDIYRPMLFVGLGGTGGRIAAELERRLRDELCGADGHDLIRRLHSDSAYLPYQLPKLTQFVYADLDTIDLARRRRSVAPAPHARVIAKNSQFVSALAPPNISTSLQLRTILDIEAPNETQGWLPSATPGEPNVNPLNRGAGQFPTVGRASLFEAVRTSPGPILSPIRRALGQFATAGPELLAFGAGLPKQEADVFVAFSVAGGTGAGIFYDYLHLIWREFENAGWIPQIFPLVVLPSALEDDEDLAPDMLRRLRLNSGRSLLDLFALVDDQNVHQADDGLGRTTLLSVRYPGLGPVRIAAGRVQTGVLFNKPSGLKRDDVFVSVAGLVLSLIATPDQDGDGDGMSFASRFINSTANRIIRGHAGVGRRGVSTSLVASLTVPVDDIAEIVSAHLLAGAVNRLIRPTGAQDNRPLVRQMFGSAGLGELWRRDAPLAPQPKPAEGATAIAAALRTREAAMRAQLDGQERRLGRRVPELATQINYRSALSALVAGGIDPFHAARVALGDHREGQRDEVARHGFAGMLEERTTPIAVGAPPPTPVLQDKFLRKVKWTDPVVVQALSDQGVWYDSQNRRLWHDAWAAQRPAWRPIVDRMASELNLVTGTFQAFAEREEPEAYPRDCLDLYGTRTGALHVLPEQGPSGNLDLFYDLTLLALRRAHELNDAANDGGIVTALLGPPGWAGVFETGYSRDAAEALAGVRGLIKEKVKQAFAEPGHDRWPLLPILASLLAAFADGQPAHEAPWQAQFARKLHALLPAGFEPQGNGGNMATLISYPAPAANANIEALLREQLGKPNADARPNRSESLVVVQFRHEMAVTDVREVRELLQLWANAREHPEHGDFLQWRQRLGYDFDWLMTTEEDRVEITHRMLCAMWNGSVRALDKNGAEVPNVESPPRVAFAVGGGYSITLPLTPLGEASSWGSLVRAYELYALSGDDPAVLASCRRLMATAPDGLNDQPVEPSALYLSFRRVADAQPAIIDSMMPRLPAGTQARARRWREMFASTVQQALDLPFSSAGALRGSLRELEQYVAERASERREPSPTSPDDGPLSGSDAGVRRLPTRAAESGHD